MRVLTIKRTAISQNDDQLENVSKLSVNNEEMILSNQWASEKCYQILKTFLNNWC